MKGAKVEIQKAREPKFSSKNRGQWETIPVYFPDGTVGIGNIDVVRGEYIYFQDNNDAWWRVGVWEADQINLRLVLPKEWCPSVNVREKKVAVA